MNLRLIIVELCLPVVVCLGLILAVPHIIAKSIVPALGTSDIVLLMYSVVTACTVSCLSICDSVSFSRLVFSTIDSIFSLYGNFLAVVQHVTLMLMVLFAALLQVVTLSCRT